MNDKHSTYGLPHKKEAVIEQLKQAYAEQNLEDIEYEKRLEQAIHAQSIEELKQVLFDFPENIQESIFSKEAIIHTHTQTQATTTPHKIRTLFSKDSQNIPFLPKEMPKSSAIFAKQFLDFRLSQIPEDSIHLPLEAIFSNITIDLRNENLEGKTLHIHITAIFGKIKILLPKGGYIQKNIQTILGNFKNRQKNKSLVKRIINLGKSSKQVETNFKVKITGSLWVSNIKVIQ